MECQCTTLHFSSKNLTLFSTCPMSPPRASAVFLNKSLIENLFCVYVLGTKLNITDSQLFCTEILSRWPPPEARICTDQCSCCRSLWHLEQRKFRKCRLSNDSLVCEVSGGTNGGPKVIVCASLVRRFLHSQSQGVLFCVGEHENGEKIKYSNLCKIVLKYLHLTCASLEFTMIQTLFPLH